MGDPTNVDPDALRAHAADIDDLASRVGTALSAAQYLSGLDDAYGVFTRPFVTSLMRDAHEPGTTALRDAAKALAGIGEQLRGDADSFQAADEATRQELDKTRTDIPGSGPVDEGDGAGTGPR